MSPNPPSPRPPSSGAGRVLLGVAVLLTAIAVGVCAAWVSRGVWRPGSLVVPWGLALSMASSAAVVLLARALQPHLGFLAAGGWVVGVFAVMSRGDTVIAGDWLGYAFLVCATVSVLGAALWGRGLG